jgi:hypothetical protein
MEIIQDSHLTETEEDFCILLVEGSGDFSGNPVKCYMETIAREKGIKEDDPYLNHYIRNLIYREDIQAYIKQLRDRIDQDVENEILRSYIRSKLIKLISECAAGQYTDRRGNALSPAPLRSVANNAIKTLMDLTPGLKVTKDDDDSDPDGNPKGLTLNVIVPKKPEKSKEQLALEASVQVSEDNYNQ